MAGRKQLQENYENALFALLMDEVATAEGKQAIERNEELKRGSGVRLPKGMERRNLKAIRAHFTKKKAKNAGRYAVKGLGRLMMAVGIIAILFTTAFATSETVRANTLNLVIKVFGESTDFQLTQSAPESGPSTITAGWLPAGFTLTEQGVDDLSAWKMYGNSKGEFIHIACTEGGGVTLSVDTEDATAQRAEINGNNAFISKQDDLTTITWSLGNREKWIVLASNFTALDDLLHVAQEITF